MKRFSISALRSLFLSSLVLTLCVFVLFYEDVNVPLRIHDNLAAPRQLPLASFNTGSARPMTERLDLQEKQCRATFPKLFADFDSVIGRSKFVLEKDSGDYKGLVQGRIKDNKLYILTTAPDITDQIIHQRTAVLSQLYRALTTSPTSLPDTPFAFVVNDNPRNNSWAFARPNKQSDYNVWLMPSFAFWSWPGATLGAFDDVLARINHVEGSTSWEKKTDKVVWRGTPWFNPLGHPTLRQDLLKAARRMDWADVEALNKSSDNDNALTIEDFCRYKYIVYTEGVTYSGRLPYHQACESVLITPPLTYLTHTAWVMRPILANDLLNAFDRARPLPKLRVDDSPPQPLLPTVRDWRAANAIYISPKFSDLEEVVMFLRGHPEVARRIARNQREAAVKAGYLSGAAETCYWRALVRTWASSTVASNNWAGEEGERFETWMLRQVTEPRGGAHGRDGG
ncbi:hypothetical protein N0V90_011008 [Kalmusia sp. IMI 367209]|nr:hypothetical protein N0V90_011008 [Kalmusia sp. IMI 367209]